MSWRSTPVRAFPLIVGISLVAGVAAFIAAYHSAKAERLAATQEQFSTLLELRRSMLGEFLQTVHSEVVLWSRSRETVGAVMVDLQEGWEELGDGAAGRLQELYVENNPHPVGEKHRLRDAGDASRYSAAHARAHDWMLPLLEHQGYYDVFLFDPHGNLVYTVFKEADFATNIVTGTHRDTGLGEVFRAARAATREDFVAFSDFQSYAPSAGKPASFLASPVWTADEQLIGVFAFQVPSGRINDIMRFNAGMGESGETYVVGPDLLMRSDSRFSSESTILRTRVDTTTTRLALGGETGVQITADYRGVPVLSAYGPVTVEADAGQVTWACLAEIDEAEVDSRSRNSRWLLGTGVLILAFMGAVVGGAHTLLLVRAERPTDWQGDRAARLPT